eukprot:5849403-Prorocentrum_lima.AAC.1
MDLRYRLLPKCRNHVQLERVKLCGEARGGETLLRERPYMLVARSRTFINSVMVCSMASGCGSDIRMDR